jgi:hypothetical protein
VGVRRDRDCCRGEAMAMTMMVQACTVARPSAASLVSSFKDLSLKSSTAPMSLATPSRHLLRCQQPELQLHEAEAEKSSQGL